MKVKIINKSGLQLPSYKTEGSAGVDLMCSEEKVELKPMERKLVSTGLFMEIATGYEGQVRPRSGLSIKHGITLVNAIGTVDSDYRGEIKIPVINLSDSNFTINYGDRIAQMVFAKVEKAELVEVDQVSDTERGSGGFGSTGI